MLSEASSSTTSFQPFDWQAVLDTWDVNEEQNKAEFLEVLYDLYQPEDHTYTGLWQQFEKDAAWTLRDYWARDKSRTFRLDSEEPKIETSTK